MCRLKNKTQRRFQRGRKSTINLKFQGILVILFLLSLAARIIKLILDPLLLRDSVLYINIAESWANNSDYIQMSETVVPPLYIYLVSQLIKCGYSAEIAGRSISIFLGAMTPVLGYIIAKKLFKKESVSLLTALLLSFHPSLIVYSTQPLRESIYLFLWELIIIIIINGIKYEKNYWWIFCGIILSLSFFSRYESVEFLLLIPLVFLYLRHDFTPPKIIKSLCFIFVFFIITSYILLQMIGTDISFIYKALKYKDDIILKDVIEDYITNDSKIGK